MVKVISLSDKAYELLQERKGGRSFSELIEEIVENGEEKGEVSKVMTFFGVLSKKNAEELEKSVVEGRKRATPRSMG